MNSVTIENFDNYLIYEDGRVYSIKNNIFIKHKDNGNGYKIVTLYNNNGYKNKYVHRLVAESFIPNPEKLKYIDHIDRDKNNNKISNLRWVSAKDNINNIAGSLRYQKSRKNPRKYSEQLKLNIKSEYSSGVSVMELSRKYDIPRQSISRFIK